MTKYHVFKGVRWAKGAFITVALGLIICLWYLALLSGFSQNLKMMPPHNYRTCEPPRNGSGIKHKSQYILRLNGSNSSAEDSIASKTTKIILAWTPLYTNDVWFGLPNEAAYANVLKGSGCTFTGDKSLVSKADMLVFHGCFQKRKGFHFPATRNPSQLYVYVNTEAPTSRYCQNPFIPADGIFNITATYKLDSDLVFSYGPPLRTQTHLSTSTINRAAGKTALAFWYMSDCSSDWSSQRHRYVQELRKFMKVDVYGSCRTYFPDSLTACPKTNDKIMDECFRKQSKKYKFYLSFENSLCSDYITEKLFNILQPDSDVVPVVLGPSMADYEKVAPPGSFVHVKNFTNPESLAKYLVYLNSSDEAYNAYHKWRSGFYYDPLPGRYSIDQHPPSQLQKLCHLAHCPPSPQVWHRLSQWFSIEDNCHKVENTCADYGICSPPPMNESLSSDQISCGSKEFPGMFIKLVLLLLTAINIKAM